MIRFEWEVKPLFRIEDLDYSPVRDAVWQAGERLAEAFRSALSGTVFPGMTSPIHMDPRDVDIHVDSASVFHVALEVNGPDLSKVEGGTPPRDLKPALMNGPRSRPMKDGSGRYNIVPFFHDRDKMPPPVQASADLLTFSRVVGHYTDAEGKVRNRYNWGSNTGDMSHAVPPGQSWTGYQHKASRYSNMVRMQGAGFMTFRTVSPKSAPNSWIIPAKPANPVSQSVWNAIAPQLEECVREAWGVVLGL